MLWSDQGRPIRRRMSAKVVLLALGAMLVSACTVQPVYGPTAGGSTVQATLAKISIDAVDDRVAQVVRNKLIFQMTGGAGGDDAVYRMKLSVSYREVALGITTIDSAPTYSVTVTASYEVTRIDTGASVVKGTSHGSASYNRVNQAFANTRAKRDAEDRAAATVANDIAIRVAAAMSRGV